MRKPLVIYDFLPAPFKISLFFFNGIRPKGQTNEGKIKDKNLPCHSPSGSSKKVHDKEYNPKILASLNLPAIALQPAPKCMKLTYTSLVLRHSV